MKKVYTFLLVIIFGMSVAFAQGTVNSGVGNAAAYYPSTGTTVDDSTGLTLDGNSVVTVSPHVTAVSANTTLGAHFIVYVTTGSTNRTITLPGASSLSGRRYTILKADSGTGVLTLAVTGSDTLNGIASDTKSVGTRNEGFEVNWVSTSGWHFTQILNVATLFASPAFTGSVTITDTNPHVDVKSNTTGQTPQFRVYTNNSTLIGHIGFNTQSGNEFSVVGDINAAYVALGSYNGPVQFLVGGFESMRITPNKHLEYYGTPPTFNGGASTSNCGVGSSTAGNDQAGAVTVGNSTNGGVCSMLTTTSWTHHTCTCANRNAPAVRPCYAISNTGAGFQLYAGATFNAGDVLEYSCVGYQ
jgi:hypothetical protein